MAESGRAEQRACLVYRQKRTEARAPREIEGVRFHFLDTPARAARLWLPLMRYHGFRVLPRVIAKLVGPLRIVYCLVEDGAIVHLGWLIVGRSPLYDVDPEDVVIGPMNTRKDKRGRDWRPSRSTGR